MWLGTEGHVPGRQTLLPPGASPHALSACQDDCGADYGMPVDRISEKEIGKGNGAHWNEVMERADGERRQ